MGLGQTPRVNLPGWTNLCARTYCRFQTLSLCVNHRGILCVSVYLCVYIFASPQALEAQHGVLFARPAIVCRGMYAGRGIIAPNNKAFEPGTVDSRGYLPVEWWIMSRTEAKNAVPLANEGGRSHTSVKSGHLDGLHVSAFNIPANHLDLVGTLPIQVLLSDMPPANLVLLPRIATPITIQY